MKPEFHPAAEQELAAAVTLGEQRSLDSAVSYWRKRSALRNFSATLQVSASRSTPDTEDFRCAVSPSH